MGVVRSIGVGRCLDWGVVNLRGGGGGGGGWGGGKGRGGCGVLGQRSVTTVRHGGGNFLSFLSFQEL